MSDLFSKNFIDQPFIEVNGEATTQVRPNQIFIKIILSEKDYKGKLSLEALEAKMLESLKLLGISVETDLTIHDMISNFRHYVFKASQINKSKEYILKVSEAATASKVFIALEEIGIPTISIDRVDHSDIENIRNTVRTKAVENAKARATALTQALDQSIGKAIYILDQVPTSVKIEYEGGGYQKNGIYKSMGGSGSSSTIEFEKINVYSAVSVKFILK